MFSKLEYWQKSFQYLFFRYFLRKKFLIAETKFGFRLKFKVEDAIGRYIYKRGIYEPTITNFLAELNFKENEVVLDIGANIGWYSLLIATLSLGKVLIYAFEPEPINFSLLKENIELNKAKGILPLNMAIGESFSKKKLYLYPDKNRGRHSILPINSGEFIEVLTIPLDKFSEERNLGNIKLVKIDVEGYEPWVFKGGFQTILKSEIVIFEFSPHFLKQVNYPLKEFVNLLSSFPFEFYLLENGKLKKVKPGDLLKLSKQTNVIMFKK